MSERRPISLVKEITANFNCVIRPYADEVPIECRVVQRAQCQSIAHDRMPLGIRIRKDVRGVEQFVVPKATEGALPVIRIKNSLAKCALVKPHPCDSGCVPTASQFLFVASEELGWLGVVFNSEMSRIINGY